MLAAPEVTFEVVATFDYPGVTDTYTSGINDRGEVVGFYFDAPQNTLQSYVRSAEGTLSDPIVNPAGRTTLLADLNNTGTMCGSYGLPDGTFRGFFLSGSAFTNFDLGAANTYLRGVNDAGNFCGTTVGQAFVSIDGTLTTFAIPDHRVGITDAYRINNLNQLVGPTAILETNYSFRRDVNGRLKWPIRAPGFSITDLLGMNDRGYLVGYVADADTGAQAATLFYPPHSFFYYNYPGAFETRFSDINNRGEICGYYLSSDFRAHGLILQVKVGN